MAAQMEPSQQRVRADYVLKNEEGLQELEDEALVLLARVRREAVAEKDPAPGRLRIDMHMHTRASFDCLSDPMLVLAAARARGVHRITITDHDRLDAALALAADFPDAVIPGEEVKTAEGVDVIGLYLDKEIPGGTPAKEVCQRIKEQGGLVYLPHPYARGKGASGRYAEELAPLVDIVEVFNGRLHPGHLNEPGEELAARWSKARGAVPTHIRWEKWGASTSRSRSTPTNQARCWRLWRAREFEEPRARGRSTWHRHGPRCASACRAERGSDDDL